MKNLILSAMLGFGMMFSSVLYAGDSTAITEQNKQPDTERCPDGTRGNKCADYMTRGCETPINQC